MRESLMRTLAVVASCSLGSWMSWMSWLSPRLSSRCASAKTTFLISRFTWSSSLTAVSIRLRTSGFAVMSAALSRLSPAAKTRQMMVSRNCAAIRSRSSMMDRSSV
jgi:hypothetical protein